MKIATSSRSFRSQRLRAIALTAAAALATIGAATPQWAGAQQDEATGARSIATGSNIPLATDAPDRYTVKQGDTLWDIAKVFLRDPWYWPEIWYINQQIQNPHLIFPGDVLMLTSTAGKPRVTVAERGPIGEAAAAESQESQAQQTDEAPTPSDSTRMTPSGTTRLSPKVRTSPIDQAITVIAYDAIAAFVGKPTMLTKKQATSGPYLMAVREEHTLAGQNDEVYGRKLKNAEEGERYHIVHVEDAIRDPEGSRVLGYRGAWVGLGEVARAGDPVKFRLVQTEREALRGDRIIAEDLTVPLDFVPHAPPVNIKGSIAAVTGINMTGANQVVAINRGTRHGIERGHVMTILEKGKKVQDRFASGPKGGSALSGRVRLPDEPIGLLIVFRTYERMSYALVMEAALPIHVGDIVRTP